MGKRGYFGGGADQDRTGDLLNAIQALSQLSYSPTGEIFKPVSGFKDWRIIAEPPGPFNSLSAAQTARRAGFLLGAPLDTEGDPQKSSASSLGLPQGPRGIVLNRSDGQADRFRKPLISGTVRNVYLRLIGAGRQWVLIVSRKVPDILLDF